jgi:2'-5' RNA ligase
VAAFFPKPEDPISTEPTITTQQRSQHLEMSSEAQQEEVPTSTDNNAIGPASEALPGKEDAAAASTERKRQRRPPKRKNRPGFNSYLKVILDERTVETLHSMIEDIRTNFEARLAEELGPEEPTPSNDGAENSNERRNDAGTAANNADSQTDPNTVESSNNDQTRNTAASKAQKKKKRVKVKPRKLESLHMTFFFGGETLCQLPEEELTAWHAAVKARLEESGFVLKANDGGGAEGKADSANDANDASGGDDDFWFRVADVRTFPPRRNNLVVAVLQASPAWLSLHGDVREIARTGDSAGLRDVVRCSKERWTPHVTLANIVGNNRAGMRLLNEQLREKSDSLDSEERVTASAIAMGGPVPEQVSLDWDFVFRSSNSRSR